MPDYHNSGKLVYSHFQNGKFSIALLDSIKIYENEQIGYSNDYYKKNESLATNIVGSVVDTSASYEDHFPPMFFMPRATMDYGKIKLGSYFYSSEILEKVSLIGVDLLIIYLIKTFSF